MRASAETDGIQLIKVVNGSIEAIPPMAVIYLEGMDTDSEGEKVFRAIKPPADNITEIVFNGPWEIGIGESGTCFNVALATASLNTGDTVPVQGDIRGAKANDWNLRSGYTGFRVLSVTSDNRFAIVSGQSSGVSAVTSTKMTRLVTPVVLHSSGLCVKAYTQKWTGPAATDYADDQEIWEELL